MKRTPKDKQMFIKRELHSICTFHFGYSFHQTQTPADSLKLRIEDLNVLDYKTLCLFWIQNLFNLNSLFRKINLI